MAVTALIVLFSAFFCVFAVSRNEAGVLQLLPGAKIRVLEGTRLVVNCTSHSDETPKEMQWNASRVNKHMTSEMLDNRTVALVIENLHRSDAGFYTCYLFLPKGKKFEKTVHVSVSSNHHRGNKNRCASTQFRCKNGMCIFLQYHCDNRNDCEDNSDEEDCGDNPCRGKFLCGNERCIPHDLVCDKFHNNDCGDMTDEMCHLAEVTLEDFLPSHSVATSYPRQTSVDDQMRWLKTTVYSVIGCTVGVVLFIAILVIAIFRIKMKRAAARRQMFFIERRRREIGHLGYNRYSELDPFLASRRHLPPHTHSNIILNVNNGVQYVPGLGFTSLMEGPPPYTDSATEVTPARGDSPPPPYSTMDRRVTNSNRVQEQDRGNNSESPEPSEPLADQLASENQPVPVQPDFNNQTITTVSDLSEQGSTRVDIDIESLRSSGCTSANPSIPAAQAKAEDQEMLSTDSNALENS